ncbi:MAG: Hpt domain-containing protein [Gemmatimonadaceae bacterium]|nr:Hpt domain-containing protein [Gemmatimonadaceae bacterium]
MTGSPELLEFYLVEATEYLDALDQLVAGTGGPPDGNAFIATARALRGSSSMAKVEPIEKIASAIEQIAHGVRDGEIRWTVDLHRVLRVTVDDLRFLVRGVRTWGERELARAEARLADLQRALPNEERRPPSPDAAATAPVFIALQSSAIAAELDAFVANPRHRRALDDALTRARTMRGIAGIADFPPLADVADAIDRTARALMPDAPLADAEAELFRAAADVLRQTSSRLRDGASVDPGAPEVARFAHAVTRLDAPRETPSPERVIAIDELFYGDSGPHIVQRSAAPPSTRSQRFRGEVTSRAEHLRRLVNDARQVHDVAGRERAERALRTALHDLETIAASFDVHQVAAFFGETAREVELFSPATLEALDAGALFLLAPGDTIEEIERRLAVLERSRRDTPVIAPPQVEHHPPVEHHAQGTLDVTPASPPAAQPAVPPAAAPVPPAAPPAPPPAAPPAALPPAAPLASPPAAPSALPPAAPLVPPPAPPRAAPQPPAPPHAPPAVRRPPPTPTGRDLQQFLQAGIAGFSSLEDEPLSEPARLEEDEIVPIESLLYRGQVAVRRAIEIRDAMRQRGLTDDASLQEIYDLLDLAQTE